MDEKAVGDSSAAQMLKKDKKSKKDKKNKNDKKDKKDRTTHHEKNQNEVTDRLRDAQPVQPDQQLQQDIATHLEDLRSTLMTTVPNIRVSGHGNLSHPNHGNQKRTNPSRAAIVEGSIWNFDVDYNDHFETPRIAYEDLQPALNALLPHLQVTTSSCTIYDPYYCQGQMVAYMQDLGFHNVINMNRDFYRDVRSKAVPGNPFRIDQSLPVKTL